MPIAAILNNKSIKPKEKTEAISQMLLNKDISINDLIDFAHEAKDSPKATCIEAIEFATQSGPGIATQECFDFVSAALTEKAPRVKWESAKVIGNVAHLFADRLDTAITNLLANTEHPGTVVRWSAAFALGKIINSGYKNTAELIPALEAIGSREEKASIKKIYLAALKKASM